MLLTISLRITCPSLVDDRAAGQVEHGPGRGAGAVRGQERRRVPHVGERRDPTQDGPGPERRLDLLGRGRPVLGRGALPALRYPLQAQADGADAARPELGRELPGEGLYGRAGDPEAANVFPGLERPDGRGGEGE